MKKYLITITMTLIVGLLIICPNIIYAKSSKDKALPIDIEKNYNIEKNSNYKFSYTSAPTLNTKIQADSGMNSIISNIAGIAGYLCAAAAVIIVVVKGVQFMNASPEGKAEIKKQMIAIVIGAALIFAITQILSIIASITANLF